MQACDTIGNFSRAHTGLKFVLFFHQSSKFDVEFSMWYLLPDLKLLVPDTGHPKKMTPLCHSRSFFFLLA